jgi:hypothetical protein
VRIVNWLIRKLGGWTPQMVAKLEEEVKVRLVEEINKLKYDYTNEAEGLEKSIQTWRDRAITAETRFKDKTSECENLNEQIKALTYALSNECKNDPQSKHFDPIRTVPLSWPRARRQMERQDHEIAEKQKGKVS